MRVRAIALVLLASLTTVALLPSAQAGFECTPVPGANVCVGDGEGFNAPLGVFVFGDDGTYVEVSKTEGTGFFGDFLVIIAIVDAPGVLRTHAGAGFSDYDFDGTWDQGCVCGGVQTPVLFVPWGVGFEDWDSDGVPDNVWVLPEL